MTVDARHVHVGIAPHPRAREDDDDGSSFIAIAVVVAVVIVGAGLLVLFVRRLTRMRGEVDGARAEFQRAVGYPWASALGGDPQRTRQKQTSAGVFSHTFDVHSAGNRRVTVQSWHLAASAQVGFQVIERSLLGVKRALLNAFGPVERTVTVSYPGPVTIGDPALDARFVLFSNDPERAAAIVRRPDVRDALLALSEVALRAEPDGISFGDPSDNNVYRQGSGASRTDFSPAPTIRSSARVHLDVERLLASVAAARV